MTRVTTTKCTATEHAVKQLKDELSTDTSLTSKSGHNSNVSFSLLTGTLLFTAVLVGIYLWQDDSNQFSVFGVSNNEHTNTTSHQWNEPLLVTKQASPLTDDLDANHVKTEQLNEATNRIDEEQGRSAEDILRNRAYRDYQAIKHKLTEESHQLVHLVHKHAKELEKAAKCSEFRGVLPIRLSISKNGQMSSAGSLVTEDYLLSHLNNQPYGCAKARLFLTLEYGTSERYVDAIVHIIERSSMSLVSTPVVIKERSFG